jgi:membrane-bound ClpP family serine protease
LDRSVITALFVCALAAAGAIFIMLELYTPFQGIIQISSKPMKEALDEISLK